MKQMLSGLKILSSDFWSLLFPLTKEKGLGLNGLDSNPQGKKPLTEEERQGLIQLTINGLLQEG